jgi:hypothetical protein
MKPSTLLRRMNGTNPKWPDTYDEELDALYDEMWNFTHRKLGNIGYNAVYIAARELGMSVEDATTFCTSKWIRHNEDYLESIFAEAITAYFGDTDGFANMMNYTED